jgi:hypothetical protein
MRVGNDARRPQPASLLFSPAHGSHFRKFSDDPLLVDRSTTAGSRLGRSARYSIRLAVGDFMVDAESAYCGPTSMPSD